MYLFTYLLLKLISLNDIQVMSTQSKYRQIFKATSLFGGVQVINILTYIIRAKFVAIFLGPVGMGISSLFMTTITLINSVSGLGLNYSAIRDISKSSATGDIKEISYTLFIFKRWLWISCILGAFVMIAFSSFLSQYTFGNKDYSWSFVFLSLMIVFNTLSNGNTALLEGTRSMKNTAKSTVVGSCVGLLTSVPLYYFFGTKGIVPSLIIGSLTVYLISAYFANKVKTLPVTVSRADTLSKGGEMAKLGIVMVAAQALGSAVIYVINTYVRSKGGIEDVGLYQAATSITNQSIGLVFTAMTIDYFPRLAAVSDDNLKIKEIVNQQAIITILISSPILICLIVFSPLFIRALLSPDFYVITDVVRWLAFGSLFTAPMVVLGFIALAKGDKKSFFLYGSFFNNILALIFYIAGYMFYGLIGMGIAFFLSQLIYILFIGLRFHKLYSFSFTQQFLKVFLIYVGACLLVLSSSLLMGGIWGYSIGGIVVALSCVFSLMQLEKYMEVVGYLKMRFFKK